MSGIAYKPGTMIDYTPTTAIAAGTVVVQNDLVGVALAPIAADTVGALLVRGIVSLPKGSSAIDAGVKVYWDATNKVVTTTASGNAFLGKTTAAAAASATRVNVLLTP